MRATSNDNFTARRVKVEARNDRGKTQRANGIGEEKRGEERRREERRGKGSREHDESRISKDSTIFHPSRFTTSLVPSRYDARNFIARRQSRLPLSLSLVFEYVAIETRRASIEFTGNRKVPLDFRLGDGSKTMDLGRRWFDTREGDGVVRHPPERKNRTER